MIILVSLNLIPLFFCKGPSHLDAAHEIQWLGPLYSSFDSCRCMGTMVRALALEPKNGYIGLEIFNLMSSVQLARSFAKKQADSNSME